MNRGICLTHGIAWRIWCQHFVCPNWMPHSNLSPHLAVVGLCFIKQPYISVSKLLHHCAFPFISSEVVMCEKLREIRNIICRNVIYATFEIVFLPSEREREQNSVREIVEIWTFCLLFIFDPVGHLNIFCWIFKWPFGDLNTQKKMDVIMAFLSIPKSHAISLSIFYWHGEKMSAETEKVFNIVWFGHFDCVTRQRT